MQVETISEQIEAIRNRDAPIVLDVVPSGYDEHISYTFAARDAATRDGGED